MRRGGDANRYRIYRSTSRRDGVPGAACLLAFLPTPQNKTMFACSFPIYSFFSSNSVLSCTFQALTVQQQTLTRQGPYSVVNLLSDTRQMAAKAQMSPSRCGARARREVMQPVLQQSSERSARPGGPALTCHRHNRKNYNSTSSSLGGATVCLHHS